MSNRKSDRKAVRMTHLDIVKGLRLAFEKCKHHVKFTKRLWPYFEAELPGYTVRVEPNDGNFQRVEVWGNGLAWDDALRISWAIGLGREKAWQDEFMYDLDRQDPSDWLERNEAEEALAPQFAALNARIEALRDEAFALIDALPTPKSVKVRVERCHWDRPSYELQEKFPLLFK